MRTKTITLPREIYNLLAGPLGGHKQDQILTYRGVHDAINILPEEAPDETRIRLAKELAGLCDGVWSSKPNEVGISTERPYRVVDLLLELRNLEGETT